MHCCMTRQRRLWNGELGFDPDKINVNGGTRDQGEDLPLIVPKEQWLRAQLITIQKLSRGEEL